LPVEIIPMARSWVTARLIALGGRAVLRAGYITDNGNQILDVHDLSIKEPLLLESQLNQIAGIVTVGLFARRPADVLLIGGDSGVQQI
jgi:ribose 5-phosphate isomerase A